MIRTKGRSAETERKISVDQLMARLALTMVRDFQDNLNDPCFAVDLQLALKTGDIASIREAAATLTSTEEIGHFKASYQLQSLFKRYRYQHDIYSDSDLREQAIKLFMETQSRIATVDLGSLSAIDNRILDRAAIYVSKILGSYSDEEHRNLCRFGSGASVGVTARKASLAARWEIPISGSQNQINWFDAEMRQYACIQEYLNRQLDSDHPESGRSIYQEIDSLTLTLVPKTFKSLRVIMPNTTIGSYMSYGLGEMIRKRLKKGGYNISDLQQRHKYYACQGSIHGLWTTADLSSASDSITVALVERLLPRDWFEILNLSRIGKVRLPDGSVVQSDTFCTMGIGYTFPLQTLVFLSLLKAIESEYYPRNDKRLISVYGDDMVYATRMHRYVVGFFERVGFVINLDKTFHEGHFRESCGGDYYRGVDVRPFQPRNGCGEVGPKAYEAILYKYINGLLMRWSEYELRYTLHFLLSEIEKVTGACKIVPSDYPDESGVKCSFPALPSFLKSTKIAHPKHLGHGVYRFSYLRFVPQQRKESRHEPYLWEALSGPASTSGYCHDRSSLRGYSKTLLSAQIDRRLQIRRDESQLAWRPVKPEMTFRSCLTGRRLIRLESVVAISHTGSYKRQSGTSCFEVRR